MEISALDRANNTDRPNNPLTGAKADLFNQMLASLHNAEEARPHDEPPEEDDAEESTQAEPADDGETAEQPNQQLSLLMQGQKGQQSTLPDTAHGDGTESALTQTDPGVAVKQTAAPVETDAAPANTTGNDDAAIAAVVQPATMSQQRATAQTAKDQNQPALQTETAASGPAKTSLRAGRDEAMAQGNGKFQGQPENNLAADRAKAAAATGEQPAQANQPTERPTGTGEPNNAQLTARAYTPAPELPKSLPPVPPAPVLAATTTPASAPTASTAAEQINQLTANARPGEAQTVAAAKNAAANKSPQASRPQPPAQQIAVHVRNGIKAGADSIHVRLHPAELGRVEVRMQIEGDKSVHAVITVESAETMDSLQRDSRTLQRALEDAGFKADAISFTFEQGESAPNQDNEKPGGNRLASGNADEDGSDPETSKTADRRSSHDGLIDIEV